MFARGWYRACMAHTPAHACTHMHTRSLDPSTEQHRPGRETWSTPEGWQGRAAWGRGVFAGKRGRWAVVPGPARGLGDPDGVWGGGCRPLSLTPRAEQGSSQTGSSCTGVRAPGWPPACPAQRSPCPLSQTDDPTRTVTSAAPTTGRASLARVGSVLPPSPPAQPQPQAWGLNNGLGSPGPVCLVSTVTRAT